MANPSLSEPAASCKAKKKLTCLCSPTNHPGSFRCSRHRTPSSASSPGRASQQQASAAPGTKSGGLAGGGGASRTASKGRSITLRVHLQRLLVSPPSSFGGDHRRRHDFKPRLSRLGRLAVNA